MNEISARWNGKDSEPDGETGQRRGGGARRSLCHHQQRRVTEEQNTGEVHRAPYRAGNDDGKQYRAGKPCAAAISLLISLLGRLRHRLRRRSDKGERTTC